MKYYRYVLLSLLITKCFIIQAQKNDYIWLSGYLDGTFNGYTKLDFNYDSVTISADTLAINLNKDNVTFSDSAGNWLFCTNAVSIFNSFNKEIENSDSLNGGYIEYVWDPTMLQYGYRLPQGILAFQDVTNANYYCLIHSYIDTVDGTQTAQAYCPRILTTLLDMSVNNGYGKVIFKNNPIIQDNLGYELASARHGNGRDWWVLVQKRNTNCYYRILIDTTGPHLLSDLTCEDSTIFVQDYGSATFSPDGSKYVYFTVNQGLKIFDFDRCSGELSNPIHISIDIWDSSWAGNGVAISPSNRFLYLSATHYIVQYDLQAPDIASSADTVGIYDGFKDPFGSLFTTAQSGPDGKIYISCGNGEADYHVINAPDSAGNACDFVQHGVLLTSYSAGVPNYPNYRLGRSVGSVCDTLYTNVSEATLESRERILKVFPNPATDIVTVDYGFTNWNARGVVSLVIVDELGQVVYSQPLPEYSGYQRIAVNRYTTGVYTAYIKRNEQVIAAQKFAKE